MFNFDPLLAIAPTTFLMQTEGEAGSDLRLRCNHLLFAVTGLSLIPRLALTETICKSQFGAVNLNHSVNNLSVLMSSRCSSETPIGGEKTKTISVSAALLNLLRSEDVQPSDRVWDTVRRGTPLSQSWTLV